MSKVLIFFFLASSKKYVPNNIEGNSCEGERLNRHLNMWTYASLLVAFGV
jgi:hypothetical protein